MFRRWLVLLLNRRDEGRFLFFCYVRCTLVCRSKRNQVVSREVLTKRHYILEITRDTKVEGLRDAKVLSQMLKDLRIR